MMRHTTMFSRRALCTAAICAFGVLCGAPASAQTPAPLPAHKLLVQAKGQLMILRLQDGVVEWQMPCSGIAHDITQLPNGNILTQTSGSNVVEIDPKTKQVVWQWDAKPKPPYAGRVEIHGFQRLKDGRTMIAETGNLRIIEVDRDGTIVHETPITVANPNSHRDTRNVRKLENGNYLVAHEGDGAVREYDKTGKVVWEYKLDLNNRPRTPTHAGHGTEVFSALRLKNGNTLIGGGNANRVIEVDKAGKVVWSLEHNDLPGIELHWVTMLTALPNGNVIVGNCHAEQSNPQIFEVTRDKRLVWSLKNWELFGNDMVASQVITAKNAIR